MPPGEPAEQHERAGKLSDGPDSARRAKKPADCDVAETVVFRLARLPLVYPPSDSATARTALLADRPSVTRPEVGVNRTLARATLPAGTAKPASREVAHAETGRVSDMARPVTDPMRSGGRNDDVSNRVGERMLLAHRELAISAANIVFGERGGKPAREYELRHRHSAGMPDEARGGQLERQTGR